MFLLKYMNCQKQFQQVEEKEQRNWSWLNQVYKPAVSVSKINYTAGARSLNIHALLLALLLMFKEQNRKT